STTRDLNAEIFQARQRLAAMTDPSSTYQARLAQLRDESVSGADELYRSTGTGKTMCAGSNGRIHGVLTPRWKLPLPPT
ncbi:MAG: hypothetical protein ACLS73_17290, partial [Bilophila wadsworthia]